MIYIRIKNREYAIVGLVLQSAVAQQVLITDPPANV